jgi:hypothetical protein
MVKDHYAHRRTLEAKQYNTTGILLHDQEQTIREQSRQIADLTVRLIAEDETTGLFGAFSASVRPTLTYAFFLMFAVVKFVSVFQAYHIDHLPALHALPILWDEETEILFSAVLSFWFGTRAMEHAKASTPAVPPPSVDDLSGTATVVEE